MRYQDLSKKKTKESIENKETKEKKETKETKQCPKSHFETVIN